MLTALSHFAAATALSLTGSPLTGALCLVVGLVWLAMPSDDE